MEDSSATDDIDSDLYKINSNQFSGGPGMASTPSSSPAGGRRGSHQILMLSTQDNSNDDENSNLGHDINNHRSNGINNDIDALGDFDQDNDDHDQVCTTLLIILLNSWAFLILIFLFLFILSNFELKCLNSKAL